MDDADLAAARMEVEEARRWVAHQAFRGPVAVGTCLNCEAPVGDGVRWCGVECRDDYEARVKHGKV